MVASSFNALIKEMTGFSVASPDMTWEATPAGKSGGLRACGMACALSIVIPVYNEEAALPLLFTELDRILEMLPFGAREVEIVLVNDGSHDRSWDRIVTRCDLDSRCVGINLSRNFGHQAALVAGLEAARGESVISMDADLQDPPDVIPKMLEARLQGYDVVYATRVARGKETWEKKATAKLFYRLMDVISGVSVPENTGDFRLLSRRALIEILKLRESHRFLRGLVPWVGFPQTQVLYDRADRVTGNTHYSRRKMLLLAVDGIASMSSAPLRLAYLLSCGLFAVFVGYIVYVLYEHFVLGGPLVSGWTSLMAAITIFGAIQLLMLGVMGEYLGRIYEQAKHRPLYIVQEFKRENFAEAPSEAGPIGTSNGGGSIHPV
jgi:dolichol-phosphate mannosyltransferase